MSGKFVIKFEVRVARSLADVKCPSFGRPVEFIKVVSVIPKAPA